MNLNRKKNIISYIIVVFLALLPFQLLYSQDYSNLGNSSNQLNPEGIDPNQPIDTLGKSDKEPKEKKPLESYLFSDSIKKQNVFSWHLNHYNGTVEFTPIDTMLNDFQEDYIFYQKEQTGVIYNGNLGGASIAQDYFNRPQMRDFSFLSAYEAYLYTPENAPYYNTKKPFTQLSYFMSGQTSIAEDQLRVIHAQNISPSTGFNLNFRNQGTKGMYTNQQAKDKNLSIGINHTGKRYTIHGGYIYNMGLIEENGGVVDDFFVKDTLIDLSANVPVNLTTAHNEFRTHQVYFTQSYGIPLVVAKEDEDDNLRNKPAIFIGNSFNYENGKKIYTDTQEGTEEGYYENWYINHLQSQDSIREQLLDTRLFLQLQPYNREGVISTLDGGFGYEHHSYYYFRPKSYIYTKDDKNVTENSLYVYANGGGQIKKYFKWDGHFKYYPIGNNSQDLNLRGNIEIKAFIKEKPITLTASASYNLEKPSYWSEHYYSNHFMWNNSFKKESETRIEGALHIPAWGIELGVKQGIMGNTIYYNADALPAQYNNALSVTAVYLQKDFRFYGVNLENRVLLQWSSAQEVVPVPFASANISYYYEFNVVKDVLRMQIGIDGYYNTSFYSFGYNPATMQFFNQRSVTTGDYIWMDAFVSGKWKRARFLIKLQHLNNELFGGRNYFQVASYPLNRRQLKFGVSWNFYD